MGVLDTSYTFQNTDTITSTKMNNIIDQSTFTSGAIFGDTLELISGQLKVRALGITSAELGTNSVTTAAIANGNVISSKLATNISIAGTFSVAGTSTFTNGLTIGTASLPVPTGSAPLYASRAWGRFSASSTGATKLAGGNIQSISRTGLGLYTITYSEQVPTNSSVIAVPVVGVIFVLTSSTTSTQLKAVNTSGAAIDPSTFNLIVTG